MTLSARRFVLLVLGTSFAVAGGLALLNYVVDPYNRFGHNRLGVYISAERESKSMQVRHYSHNALLLGNSRMAMVPADRLNGFHFFNGAFGGGTAEEAYYFAPQGQTKIMNEGWASFWHSTIMTQKTLHPSELVDYADHYSGTMATQPGRLNPYKLGIELLRDIEERWNKGQFGPEWDECDNLDARRKWDKKLGLGRQKIFEVRRIHNDVTFIDTFLTVDFCRRYKLFSYRHNDQTEMYEIESREFKKIKERLLFNLTNFGQPIIRVKDANHRNRGELYMQHEYFGVDLRIDHAQDTLRHLHRLWTRPVHLETSVDGRPTLLSFDGTDHSIRPLGGSSHESEQKDRRRA